MKLYLESQMPPKVSYNAYKAMIRNITSVNSYKPKSKDCKLLCMTYNLLNERYYHKEENKEEKELLKTFLSKVSSKAFNSLLIKNEPISYYLLSNGVNYYSEFLYFNKKNIQYNFINNETQDNLLMTFYKAETHCPDVSAQMTDILLSNGVDVQHINADGQNIVDLMVFPYLEKIDRTDYVLELYDVVKKHNKDKILFPENWNNFVFDLYSCYPQETIDKLENKLKVSFLDKIDNKTYEDIVFNAILYNKEDKKNTIIIKRLIDGLPDKKVLNKTIEDLKTNKWTAFKIKTNDTTVSDFKFLALEKCSNVKKPEQIMTASLYRLDILTYIFDSYSSYINNDVLNDIFKYIDDNMENLFINTKQDLFKAKKICEGVLLKNNSKNINKKSNNSRML